MGPIRTGLGAVLLMAAWLWPAEAGAQDNLVERHLRVDGVEREYLIYRPDSVTGPAPLVIMLHGGGGNAQNGADMSGLADTARANGFVAVFPEGNARFGKLRTWNAGHCCAYAMNSGADDVAFLSALIDSLVADGIADPARIYMTGMSNGAMMTHRAGRELSGKITAIAPVVGALFGDEAAPGRPVSALIITGDKDSRVPRQGGYGDIGRRRKPADAPYAPASLQFDYWAEANLCRGAPLTEETAGWQLMAHEDCAEGTRVYWYALKEGGHAWPGGRRGREQGDMPVSDFDASSVIWDFLKEERR